MTEQQQKDSGSKNSLIALDLRQKEIVWLLPAGCSCNGATLNLTGGALIQGDFSGSIFSERGTIVIAKGATFSGYAEADEIYVAGEVGQKLGHKRSGLLGRAFLAISEDAIVNADITSRIFSIYSTRVTGAMNTLDGEPPARAPKVEA